jgi:hypothetical protein
MRVHQIHPGSLEGSRPERVPWLFAWDDEMHRTIGDPHPANKQADVDHDLAIIRLQLDEKTLQAARAAGRVMTVEQAFANAPD